MILKKKAWKTFLKGTIVCLEPTLVAIEAMGLKMVAPDSPADSATGCFVP